jgi:GntR family transcriptional regulator
MRLDFDLAKPIYAQIVDEVKRAVARGELIPGDRIPSQREMAQALKVNPNTVQRAYQEMERCGLVETSRGEGTFVRNDRGLVTKIRREMADETLRVFIADMRALGLSAAEVRAMVEEALERGCHSARPGSDGPAGGVNDGSA